jgi:hypothetical protein
VLWGYYGLFIRLTRGAYLSVSLLLANDNHS